MARITGTNATSPRASSTGSPDELPPPTVGWVEVVRPAGRPTLEPTVRSVEGLLAELWGHLPPGCRRIIREACPRLYVQERRPEGPDSGPAGEEYRAHPDERVLGSWFLIIRRDDGSVAWRRYVRALLLHLLAHRVVGDVAPAALGEDEGSRSLCRAVTGALVTSWGLREIWARSADDLMDGEPV